MTTTMITTSNGANGITFLPTPLTQQQQQQLFGTPAIPGIQVVPAAHPSRVEAFLNRQSMGLGITLVISGTLAIIFNIVGLVVSDSLAVVGHGFYCGVMFIVTGGFGIGAAVRKTKCMIITFMVLAILSAVLTVNLFIVGIVGATTNECYRSDYGYDSCSYNDYSNCRSYVSYTPPCGRAAIAMEALQACLAIVGAVASIWGSAICCKAACCCRRTTYSGAILSAQYAGQPVVIFQQQQQVLGGPQAVPGAPLPTHPAAQYWVASPCQPQAQSSAIPALPVYENMLAVQTAGNIPPPAYSPITAASAPVGMPCNKI